VFAHSGIQVAAGSVRRRRPSSAAMPTNVLVTDLVTENASREVVAVVSFQ
jgi:ethanolamine utilization protein EutQ (cupin superfamily)